MSRSRNTCTSLKKGTRVIFAGDMQVRADDRLGVTDNGDLVIAGFEEDDAGDYDCELETDDDVPVYIRHSVTMAMSPMVTTVPASGRVTITQVIFFPVETIPLL